MTKHLTLGQVLATQDLQLDMEALKGTWMDVKGINADFVIFNASDWLVGVNMLDESNIFPFSLVEKYSKPLATLPKPIKEEHTWQSPTLDAYALEDASVTQHLFENFKAEDDANELNEDEGDSDNGPFEEEVAFPGKKRHLRLYGHQIYSVKLLATHQVEVMFDVHDSPELLEDIEFKRYNELIDSIERQEATKMTGMSLTYYQAREFYKKHIKGGK